MFPHQLPLGPSVADGHLVVPRGKVGGGRGRLLGSWYLAPGKSPIHPCPPPNKHPAIWTCVITAGWRNTPSHPHLYRGWGPRGLGVGETDRVRRLGSKRERRQTHGLRGTGDRKPVLSFPGCWVTSPSVLHMPCI